MLSTVKIAKYIGFCVYRRSYLVFNMVPRDSNMAASSNSETILGNRADKPALAVEGPLLILQYVPLLILY